jgi:aryl-alcohol dehydrogenase-like predicted oxidoreductase
MDRRDFLKTATTAAGVAATEQLLNPMLSAADKTPGAGEMIYRTLGRTGERVSAIGLGGFHIGQPSLTEQESIRLIHQAVDRGINFLDNCWDYNGGESEVRMGKALAAGYRGKVFLMTKVDGRTKAAAASQIDDSLRRLQTDHIDLMQHHEIIRLEDPDRVFAEGGSMEAFLDAKKAGKIRYIGFTGHKDPLVHLRMLEVARKHQFHFDTAQMPNNVMDAHFRSFAHNVLPVLNSEGIAPLGMKGFSNGVIFESKTVNAIECLHYCLTQPISVQINGMEKQADLDQAFEAVRTFHPLSASELASLLERTRLAAQDGKFERSKTSTAYDGTAHNPQWLG